MWRYCLIILVALSSGTCQYLAQQVASSSGGHATSGWDIRLAVPGEPDRDYPTLDVIPKTGFSCAGKVAGYYADVETRCQVFRVCTIGATYGFQSFLCPNGTLFNQEVFVCDWWMNVNCQGSQRYFNNNNEKFGNLRLGPSMMSDIKKMLTYPMQNPYDKNNLNNNQFVMQVYNPPSGQPFSNRGLGGNNFINQEFRPVQQLQLPVVQNSNYRYNENQFSGSTPSPQYIAANVNEANFINNARLAQIQNGQYQNVQNNQYLNSQNNGVGVSNENNVQLGQLRNENGNSYLQTFVGQNMNIQNGHYKNEHNSQLDFALNSQAQYNNFTNAQFQDGLANSQKYQFSNTQNAANQIQASHYNNEAIQTGKQIQYANNFNGQYNEDAKTTSTTGGRQNELEVTFTKQQYTYPSQFDKQYTYKISADQANNLQVGRLQEVKHNLVSESNFNKSPITPSLTNPVYSSPNVVTKSVSVTHGIKSEKSLSSSIPNSRITYKTWVVQPSKSDQLVSKQASYKYERPKSARQYVTSPTVPSRLYLTPSTFRSIISSKFNVPPTRSIPSSRQYLAPSRSNLTPKLNFSIAATTLKPSRLYLNPSTSRPTIPARVYSSPNPSIAAKLTASKEPIYNRNNQLYASASTLAPVYLDPLKNDVSNQSFTITKHSHINTNHNNLTFTDILTKEKLDFTVNDIVKDTSDILETTESKLGQLREEPKNNADSIYPSPVYLPSQTPSTENRNITTTLNLIPSTKPTSQSARLTQNPSTSLQLPVETLRNNRTNQIANLPYYKQKELYSQTNLEKFVSFKITVPQRTAKFILQSKNESEFDKLEILTAGKSNYLVLVNNGHNSDKPRRNFIPLGKLIGDKNSNISNPQAFVYDFLANSINAAKTYENTLNENAQKLHFATANVFGQQFQNIDAEDLSDISKKISELTSAQYKNNNIIKSNQHQTGNLLSTSQTTTETGNTYRGSSKFTNNQQIQNGALNQIRSGQLRQSPEINGNFYSSNFYNGNADTNSNLQVNSNDLQNGKYYQSNLVKQNINQQTPTNSAYSNNAAQHNVELNEFHANSNVEDANINISRESAEVELVNAGLQNADRSAAKLQVAPTAGNSQEAELFNTVLQSSTRGSNENSIGTKENGIGARFHNQVVGTINHPKSDKNLITYKADKSFYVYTKYVGNSGSKSFSNTEKNQFGELRQAEQSDGFSKVEQNNDNGREVLTTVQFIPSLSFELDDENDQRNLVKVLQNQGEHSAAYTSSVNGNGYNQNAVRVPTSSADYSVQRTTSTNQGVLQQFKQVPANLYAGPSSYLAPQSSVGRLEPQSGQLNALPSPPANGYPPARLEEFDESNEGYPKVTPAIPFSF